MHSLNPVLQDFWLTPARNRVLHGGRSSGKSWDAAGVAIYLARECKIRFLCTRQLQNKIEESVYSLLKIQIDNMNLKDEFKITNNKITHKRTGSEFMFYGLWRHIEEIKSLESIDICWIEEAHALTKNQWEILEPTVRKEGSQFWIIFNPKFANDFTYKRFVTNPPPNTIVKQINYLDNPFLSNTILDVIHAAKEEDYEDYQHVYLGLPRDNDDSAVISRSWVQSAIDAHKQIKPVSGSWGGPTTIGYDVADDGNDRNATTTMRGATCVHLDEWKGDTDGLFDSAKRVRNTAKRFNAVTIGYDCIGVGASTGSHLNNLEWRNHFRFNVGSKVVNPKRKYRDYKIPNEDFFADLKAQAWWLLADRFRNTHLALTKGEEFPADEMVSISSECNTKLLNKLIDELSTPLRDFDNTGRVKVESKKDLAKRQVESPNIADSFVIANSRGMLGNRAVKEIL